MGRGPEFERTVAALLNGWSSLFVPLLILFVVLGLWGLLAGRGLRLSDRGPLMPWGLLLVCYGQVLLLRAFDGQWAIAATLCGALLVAGFVARVAANRALWFPAVLLGGLLGMGWMLSALFLSAAGVVVFLFVPRKS